MEDENRLYSLIRNKKIRSWITMNVWKENFAIFNCFVGMQSHYRYGELFLLFQIL